MSGAEQTLQVQFPSRTCSPAGTTRIPTPSSCSLAPARDPFTPPRTIPAVLSSSRSRKQQSPNQPACEASMSQGQRHPYSAPAESYSPSMSPLSRPFSSLRNSLPAVTTAITSPRPLPTAAVPVAESTTITCAPSPIIQTVPSPPTKIPAMQAHSSYPRHPGSALDSFMSTMDSTDSSRAHAQSQAEAQAKAQAHMHLNLQPQQPMSAPFAAPPGHRSAPPIRAELFGPNQARGSDPDPGHRLVAFPSPGLVPRPPKLTINLSQSSLDPTSSRMADVSAAMFPSPPPTRPSGPYPGVPSNPPTPTQNPMAAATPPHPAANQDDLNETQLLLAQDAAPLLPQVPLDAPHYTPCLAYERTLAHAAANNLPSDKLSLNPISAVMTILSKRKVPVTEVAWDSPERTYGPAIGKRFACVVHVLGKTYATRAKYLNKERAKRDAAWLVLMALWCTGEDQWREATRWVTGMDLHRAAESGKMMSLADYFRVVTRDNPAAKVPGRAGVPIVSEEVEGLSAAHAQYLVGGSGSGGGTDGSAAGEGDEGSPMACPPTAPMTPAVLSRKTPKSRVLELGSKIGSLNPVWGAWSRAANGEWQIELTLGASGVSAIGSGSKRKEAEDAAALTCLRSVLEHPQWGQKLKADPVVLGKCFAGLEASASMSVGDGKAELVPAHGSPSAPADPFRQHQLQHPQKQHAFPPHNPLPAVPTSSHLGAVDAHSWYDDDSSDFPIPTPLPDDLEFKHDPEVAMTPLLLGQPGIGQPNIWSTNAGANPNPVYRPDQHPDSMFANSSAPTLHHSLPAVPHPSAFNARDLYGSTSPSVNQFAHSPASSAASTATGIAHSAWTARMQLEDECAKFGFPITFTVAPASSSPHTSPSSATASIHGPRQWTVRVHVWLAPKVELDAAHSGANRLAVMESVAREALERITVWYGATQIAQNP